MPVRRTARGDGPDRPDDVTSDGRSTGEVLASLVVNTQALLAKEVELVGLEMKALVGRKVAAVAGLLVGALAGAGVLMLGAVTAAIALEGMFDERWMAWGAVTLGAAAIAIVLVLIAVRRLSRGWSLRDGRSDRTSTNTWLRELGEALTDSQSGPTVPAGADEEDSR
jgi:hypothetical protein